MGAPAGVVDQVLKEAREVSAEIAAAATTLGLAAAELQRLGEAEPDADSEQRMAIALDLARVGLREFRAAAPRFGISWSTALRLLDERTPRLGQGS
jgi:hypothetical protein